MPTKYVITKVQDRRIAAEFQSAHCSGLTVLNENGLTGNIYIGRVENVVKNMNCAFIEFQKGMKGYYPLDMGETPVFLNRKNDHAIHQGDFILVQVCREAVKTKPATLTCKLSLSGKYVVLSSDVTGILISGKTRKEAHCLSLKQLLSEQFSLDAAEELPLAENQKNIGRYGFILRTNSAEAEDDEVLSEAGMLVSQYGRMLREALYATALTCVYTAPPQYLEAVQNIRTGELSEIVTDDPDVHRYFLNVLPKADAAKVRLYTDDLLPLSRLYELDAQLDHALRKKVWLKCGGYLVIEQTEALSVIDVNTGKCITKKQGTQAKEDTLFKVNMEAAGEIARQLKLRNLSGIIIIDFINMKVSAHNDELMHFLKRQLRQDSVPSAVVDITKLGLVELTRRRCGKSLSEAWNGTV